MVYNCFLLSIDMWSEVKNIIKPYLTVGEFNLDWPTGKLQLTSYIFVFTKHKTIKITLNNSIRQCNFRRRREYFRIISKMFRLQKLLWRVCGRFTLARLCAQKLKYNPTCLFQACPSNCLLLNKWHDANRTFNTGLSSRIANTNYFIPTITYHMLLSNYRS